MKALSRHKLRPYARLTARLAARPMPIQERSALFQASLSCAFWSAL